uniref:Proteasomal ubiquitin receptor ADRM1-like n=1 Tax=Saccoglossus kowalevskii TaxID=10224 RepID=A0ABM0MEB2_SACKO|nr:PREDICTED: proteasomal ubiquitin receptor ADRM1-like [Saccoglossus kowalevskii]
MRTSFRLQFKDKYFSGCKEGKTDKDEENCKKLNEFLNNPPPPGSSGGNRSSGLPSELAAMGGEGGLGGMLGNMDQQQLMQLLGGRGLSALGGLGALIGEGRPNSAQSSTSSTPSRTQSALGQTRASGGTTTAASSSVGAGTSGNDKPASQRPSTAAAALPTQTPKQPIQLSDLQSILGSMNLPAGQSNQSEQRQSLSIDLSQAISADVMAPILTNSEIQKQLMEHLPVGESLPRDPEQLSSTLQSPQFQQAMSLFGMALQSGQLGPLMGQFGLNAQAIDAANKGDLEGFARAMQTVKPADKKDKESSDKGKNEKDDDESMSVD